MGDRSPYEIPNFLRAKTPEGLKKEMLKVNAILGFHNKFFDIQFVNGEWFCWFYKEDNRPQSMFVKDLNAKSGE